MSSTELNNLGESDAGANGDRQSKPLAHNVWQVRTLRKAMHRYGVQTVMGNQGHTTDGCRRVKEWFDAGILGEVREVHCWTNRPCNPWFIKPQRIPPTPQSVPDGLDWELWQGPVAERCGISNHRDAVSHLRSKHRWVDCGRNCVRLESPKTLCWLSPATTVLGHRSHARRKQTLDFKGRPVRFVNAKLPSTT